MDPFKMKAHECILPPVPSSIASLVMLATLWRMAEKKRYFEFLSVM